MSTKKNLVPFEEPEEEMFDFDSVTPIGRNSSIQVNSPESSHVPSTVIEHKDPEKKVDN